jgi:hypothetical protein
LAGSASVPLVAWKTICADPPAWLAKFFVSKSVAFCDSTPGTVNLSTNSPPAALPTANRAMTTASHASNTLRR